MKILKSRLFNIRGLSLIEILIAMLMTAIITTAIFKVYINQHKNWVVQDEITNMQQNARAAIDELTRQARMAGHELPLGLPSIVGYNTNPDTIIINYTSGGCYTPIVHSMPLPSSELRCDGYDVSCFQDGQMAYIYHPDSGGGEFFEISLVQAGSQHIQHNDWPLSKCYDKDAIIVSLEQVKFYIDTTTDPQHPALMMQLVGQPPAVYAENIEDLQFRYRMKNGNIVDVPIISEDIREVILSLTARIDKPDPDFANDPYRRRAYSSRVNLRNI
jgi:type II secretory pathway pseudopilin PulG